jgi:single-stranded DNA-binding protein
MSQDYQVAHISHQVNKFKKVINMLSRIEIIGNVGDKPEVNVNSQTGESFISFNVAVNFGKGEQKTTRWYQCSLSLDSDNKKIKSTAEYCRNYLSKGDKVFIEGLPGSYAYINSDKKLIHGVRIHVSTVEHVSNKAIDDNNDGSEYSENVPDNMHFDDAGFNQPY